MGGGWTRFEQVGSLSSFILEKKVYNRLIEFACSNYYFKMEIGSSGNLALVSLDWNSDNGFIK